MTTTLPPAAADLFRQALTLPEAERAELADALLDSLGPPPPISEEWRAEIVRRADAYARGEMPASDWRESLARVEAKLRERHT